MGTDIYNVWDELYEMMCIPCIHHDYCHGFEDDGISNDQQVVNCIRAGQIKRVKKQVVSKESIDNPIGDC